MGQRNRGWVIEDYYHFRRKKYSETASSLGTFPIDAKGHLDASFKVPEDYGGVHEVTAIVDGKRLDLKARKVSGYPELLQERVASLATWRSANFSVSRTGAVVWRSGTATHG
jgi:hypothetical protein